MTWESRLILVAEDSNDDFLLLTRAFRKAEFLNPVQRVKNGEEAVLYLSGQGPYADRSTFPAPYLLLLDLKMPLMHGLDVLVWIRNHASMQLLPVVVFSSSVQPSDIRESYSKGANGFVTKSSSVTALVEVVAAIHAYWIKANRVEN